MRNLLYIDPGTGTILFQMIIAGVVTVISVSKRLRLIIKNYFNSIFKRK